MIQPSMAQRCSSTDSLALIDLYQSTKGNMWAQTWDLTLPVSSWYGIKLSTAGRVISVNLQTNNLNGKIPELNLPELEILRLGFNQLSGSIPNFQLMPKLQDLFLSTNKLVGKMPPLEELKSIKEIDISLNQLSGAIPEISSASLGLLNLSNNKLSGGLPASFAAPNLLRLNLSNNELTGTIPDFIGLYKLEELNLSNNKMTGTIPNFSGLPVLKFAFFSRNKLTGTVPDFARFAKLQRISLDDNSLSGKLPEFSYLPELRFFSVSRNKLSGTVPSFSSCRKKENLDISCNKFTFDGIEQHVNQGYVFSCSNQDSVKITQIGNYLSFEVGGTPNNLYFAWYRNDSLLTNVLKNSSTILLTASGRYRCVAKNSATSSPILISSLYSAIFNEQILVKESEIVAIADRMYPKGIPSNTIDNDTKITHKLGTDLTFAVPQAGAYVVKLLDAKGQVICEQPHAVSKKKVISIPLIGIKPNVYFLQITATGVSQIHVIEVI